MKTKTDSAFEGKRAPRGMVWETVPATLAKRTVRTPRNITEERIAAEWKYAHADEGYEELDYY